MKVKNLIDLLNENKSLSHEEWHFILENYNDKDREYAQRLAQDISIKNFGRNIYFRGIIEFTNICKNDCYYCGIRCSNKKIPRYRLTKEDILLCAKDGYDNGYRTFVLQGGEDGYYTDDVLCDIISTLCELYPDCAVTISVGERSRNSYEKLYAAGARRYLLRHEAANCDLYRKLHPDYQSHKNRLRCLYDLKEIGFQTGCGFMVGVPHQTTNDIADDMCFIHDFKPQMIGIGPFIPHCDTPFGIYKTGNTELTLLLLSLSRIMFPRILMPATTALGTAEKSGHQLGVLSGCNVIMPNLSPIEVRKKYMLYDNKAGTELDAKTGVELLKARMNEIGYNIISDIGNYSVI